MADLTVGPFTLSVRLAVAERMANVIDLRSRHSGAGGAAESLRGALSDERGLVDDPALDRSG
jgi:hypothetical protein